MIQKVFKALMAALLVSFGATALAQCMPMHGPGPPRFFDPTRGCYVPGGTQPLQANGQVVYEQQIFQQPQYVGVQPAYGYGQQQQVIQSLPQVGIPGGVSKCEAVGALAGGTIGSYEDGRHRAQNTILGALLGGIVGNIVCTPTQQGASYPVGQQPMQQHVQSAGMPQNQNLCGHDPGTRRGILNFPGNPKHGQPVCAPPGDPRISQWLQ